MPGPYDNRYPLRSPPPQPVEPGLPAIPNPLGLLSGLFSQPAAAPLPTPALQPQGREKPGFKWTPEAVMKAQQDLANQYQGKPIVTGGGFKAHFPNAVNGFMGGYLTKQQMDAAAENERMRDAAAKAAMGAKTPEEMNAALAGFPGYADIALKGRMEQLDPHRQAQLELEREKLNQVRRRAATEERLFGDNEPAAAQPPPAMPPSGVPTPGIAVGPQAQAGGQPAQPDPSAAPATTISSQTAREVLAGRSKADRDLVRSLWQQDPEKAIQKMLEWSNPKTAEFGTFKDKVNYEQDLRKEFTGQPAVKEYAAVRDSYTKLQGAAADKSAAGDISMIFSFMKMLDPTSTVREGEQAMAQNATGVPGRIQNLYNQVLAGNRLNEDQRLDFQKQAKRFHDAHHRQYETLRGQYATLAKRRGIDPADIALDFGKVDEGQESPYGSGPARPQAQPAPGAVPAFNPPPPQRQGSTQLPGGLSDGPQAPPPDPLAEARDALSKGAPREKVLERLNQLGINPSGL